MKQNKKDFYRILDNKIPFYGYEMTELSLGRVFQVNLLGDHYKLEIIFRSFEGFTYSDRDNKGITFSYAENLDDWDLNNYSVKGNPIYILGQDSNYFAYNNHDSEGYLRAIDSFYIAIVTRLELIDVITREVPTIKVIKLSTNKEN